RGGTARVHTVTRLVTNAGRAVGTALAALGAVAAGAFAYGAIVERNRFVVRRETVPILDAGADPIRVLHLSDIHLAPWQERKQQWIRSLAELRPDIVVSTGDNTGHVDSLDALAFTLEAFRGVPGVFVHGSNDFYAPEPKNPFGYFTSGEQKPVRREIGRASCRERGSSWGGGEEWTR